MIPSKTKTCNTIIMVKTMSLMPLNIYSKSFGHIFAIQLMEFMQYFIGYFHLTIELL